MGDGKYIQLIQWKTDGLVNEFPKLDNRLRIIVYSLAGYVYYNFGKGLLVTEIFRTQQEQDQIYSTSPEYKAHPWFSVHQYWRGIDLRTIDYTDQEIDQIMEFVNKNFIYGGTVQTAVLHNVGYGIHLHLQVNSGSVTDIVKI